VTFARRLVLGTVIVLLFTILVLIWSAERSLRRNLESDVANTLLREARLVRAALPPDSAEWPAAIRRLALENGIRIVLLDREGHIRADSGELPARPSSGDPLADVELPAALVTGGPTPVVRREVAGTPRLYVALPGGPGVIALATSLSQVNETVRRARGAVAGGALVALAIGSLLAFVAGRSITRPLGALVGASRAIAAGVLPRFPRSGVPDIDVLVQALRQMHRQLADRFEELRRERAETAALVQSMTEGVIAADGRGRITTANPAARRLLGYEAEQNLPDLPELFRIKAAREVVDAVLAGTPVQNRELELDDSVLIVNARPLPAGGAVLVLHDVTELRRLEAVRRDFVANVSHELKTPLTSISGYAETILTDRPAPELEHRFLATIVSNTRRMQRLVDDLLDLSRIESGRWQPNPETVDVVASARDAWAGLGERAAAGGVEFTVEVPPDATVVDADPDAVRQVLTNLFDNSLRYTPRAGRITLRSKADGTGVLLSVSDTGPGIPSEHLPRIFERFYRADSARSREEGGTGLGLAIVKHLVEAHGGRVWAESERGRGTTVYSWFPGPGNHHEPA
jgi:two-component system, OmpR family, phosphate regulon sensor histidine kinase PhoR